MGKNLKKALALFFAVVMLVSVVTIVASAEDVTSGSCGENVTWNYNTNAKTLTISGTGYMNNFDFDFIDNNLLVTTAPWGSYYNSINTVVIQNGVINIGDSAFEGCITLKSIQIPGSVVGVGNDAFFGCAELTNITLSENINYIGDGSFSNCPSIEKISVSKGNTVYHSTNNCLVETESKTMIAGCKNSVIPDDGSVTRINGAFSGCTSLKSIKIPDSVTSIGSYAFSSTGLKSIIIPNSVTSIGLNAFIHCAELTSATISESITIIDSGMFYGCKNLKSIIIPNSVTKISDSAFAYCGGLTSISIPVSVVIIGDFAFGYCDALKDVYYAGNESDKEKIDIKAHNSYLLDATWHYNTVGPDSTSTGNVFEKIAGFFKNIIDFFKNLFRMFTK